MTFTVPTPRQEHLAFAALYDTIYGALWTWLNENGKELSPDEKQDLAADITEAVRKHKDAAADA